MERNRLGRIIGCDATLSKARVLLRGLASQILGIACNLLPRSVSERLSEIGKLSMC